MNSGRHLNDIFARRQVQQPDDDSNNEDHHEEIGINEDRHIPAAQPQPNTTLMDMLMNGNRTTTITMGGSSNVSPAVLDYMRVTTQQQSGKSSSNVASVAVALDTVPLEDMYEARYAERRARIGKTIENRDADDCDEDEEEEDEPIRFDDSRESPRHRHRGEMSDEENNDEEDEAMMRELMGDQYDRQRSQPPPKKKQKVTRKVTPPSKDSCFLCSFGDRFHDGIKAPHIARLVQIIDKLYGRMRNKELAYAVHLYFMAKIYRKDEGMCILEAHVVLEHIEGRHSLAALNFIVESIHDYEQIKFIAKGCIMKADGSIDHKAFAAFNKAQEKLEKLYTMNIEKMNFNNGQTIEDLNSKGAYFNLMPMFSQKEEHLRRIKRKASEIESAANTFDFY